MSVASADTRTLRNLFKYDTRILHFPVTPVMSHLTVSSTQYFRGRKHNANTLGSRHAHLGTRQARKYLVYPYQKVHAQLLSMVDASKQA